EEQERPLDVVRRHPAVEADLVLTAAESEQSVEAVEELEDTLVGGIRPRDEAGDPEAVERVEEVIDLGGGLEVAEAALDPPRIALRDAARIGRCRGEAGNAAVSRDPVPEKSGGAREGERRRDDLPFARGGDRVRVGDSLAEAVEPHHREEKL